MAVRIVFGARAVQRTLSARRFVLAWRGGRTLHGVVAEEAGETYPGRTTVTLERGETILVLRNVPAQGCANCGEAYVDEMKTTEEMIGGQKVVWTVTARDTIPLPRTGRHHVAISLKLPAPPSDEEILELSRRNPGLQIERTATGELIVSPTGGEAGRREAEIVAQLHRWATQDGRGIVFGPSTGFHLPDGAVLSPDASWVRRERWAALTSSQRQGFAPLCPDAVFEIASPTDALRDLRRKMQAYLSNGARLAALIDPQRRAVEICTPDRDPRVIEAARSVTLDPVLPGFALDLEPVFE